MGEPRLNVTTSDHLGSTLVHVEGEIDLATAPQFERELQRTGPAGELIIDLSGVAFMDSTAVGVLARKSKQLADDDRRLILVSAAGAVRRVLEVSGLDKVIPVYADLESAARA